MSLLGTPTQRRQTLRAPAHHKAGRLALIAAVGIYLALVLLAPISALIQRAFGAGLGALVREVSDPEALDALRMSWVLVAIAVLTNAFVGVLGALTIVRHRCIGRGIISALADLPLAISPVMVGLAFLLLVGRQGLLTPILDALGWKVVYAFPALVIATLFVTLPFTIREVAYALEELGTSEEEAASTLGATPWQTFWRITLPNIRLSLAYGVLMTAARSLGEFGAILVLGGNVSHHTRTATTFIQASLEERDVAGADGMAMVLASMSVVALLALDGIKKRRRLQTTGKER